MMAGLNFDSIKKFLFDLFVVASFAMTLLKMLAIEWRSLKRFLSSKRRKRSGGRWYFGARPRQQQERPPVDTY
jgi:hypothetical protein